MLIPIAVLAVCLGLTDAIDGGTLKISTASGWKAMEIVTEGDKSPDNIFLSMPGLFDGAGAYIVSPDTLRIQLNHELYNGNATISEVDLRLSSLKSAISNMITSGSTGGVKFVIGFRQAYKRWSSDGGSTWIDAATNEFTNFLLFCSSQAYKPNTFGQDRGFVNQVYVTGEESADTQYGRLFVIDSVNRDLYQLSNVTGSAPNAGIGGMPSDAWENAALIDTSETAHVALVLSADGGSQRLRIYIGVKGKDRNGNTSSSFLARNGLAYGSWYFLNGATFPSGITTTYSGTLGVTASGNFSSTKFEDVDTNPNNPKQIVLGNQSYGVFVLDFSLSFEAGSFRSDLSTFTYKMISANNVNADNQQDNVDWTQGTTLGGINYPNGLIFVNEDNLSGEIWQMNPDGTNKVRVGQTTDQSESTGIFDLSKFVRYKAASIIITNSQGSPSSMTLLIHPQAALITPQTTPRPTPAPTPATYTLKTRKAGGNSVAGNMFDLVAKNYVDITTFHILVGSRGSTLSGSVYRRNTVGTYVGYENNMAAWTLLQSFSIVSKGASTFTPLPPLGAKFRISAGVRRAFYITINTSSMRDTTGNLTGALFKEDVNLKFFQGAGKFNATTGTVSPRIWNGKITYTR